jgi:hypothetical protein
LLVDEELARAVRCESSLAIQCWWGVSPFTVWHWRKAFGVSQFNEGSARLRRELNVGLAEQNRGRKLTAVEVERRQRTAVELNLGRNLIPGYHGTWWSAEELALLGTDRDAVIAANIGRTPEAVRRMRRRQGIARAENR